MSDSDWLNGANLSRRSRVLAGLTREQIEAHGRLASLPRRVHVRSERSLTAARIEGADQSNRAKAAKGGRRGQGISLPGSRPAKHKEGEA